MTDRRVVSNNLHACSTRQRSTYSAGETPVSARNTREKCRVLIPARAVRSGTVSDALGCSTTKPATSRIAFAIEVIDEGRIRVGDEECGRCAEIRLNGITR